MQQANPLVIILILLAIKLPDKPHSVRWSKLYPMVEWLGILPLLTPYKEVEDTRKVPVFLRSSAMTDIAYLTGVSAAEVYYTYLDLAAKGLIDDHRI